MQRRESFCERLKKAKTDAERASLIFANDLKPAVARLLTIALRDTHQSRHVADFLLAWHNASENGAWDPTDLWTLDAEIRKDILTCIQSIAVLHGAYPGELDFRQEYQALWKRWRGCS